MPATLRPGVRRVGDRCDKRVTSPGHDASYGRVGLWMAHCHIAENHESGMMFSFNVDP